jgi:hypothetical protein
MGSTLKYLSNYATLIPCSWGLLGGKEKQNTQYRFDDFEDRRGDAIGPLSVALSTPLTPSPLAI